MSFHFEELAAMASMAPKIHKFSKMRFPDLNLELFSPTSWGFPIWTRMRDCATRAEMLVLVDAAVRGYQFEAPGLCRSLGNFVGPDW